MGGGSGGGGGGGGGAAQLLADAVLAYAWGKVCFSTWDDCLAHGAAAIRWNAWPRWLRDVLHALYPAYFIFSSAKRLTGPEASRASSGTLALLAAAAALCTLRGAREGTLQRRMNRHLANLKSD